MSLKIRPWVAATACVAMLALAACGGAEDTADAGDEATSDSAAEQTADAGTEAADAGPTEAATTEGEDSSGAGSGDFEWVDGVLQPLSDGFPEQEITLLVADEAGSPDGVYARQLQDAAEELSPVPIQVVDRTDFTSFGTWEALSWVLEQPEGATGHINIVFTAPGGIVDLHTAPVVEDLGLDLEFLQPVIATEDLPYVVHKCAEAPWESMEQLVEYTRENPGELRYISGGAGSGQDVAFLWYLSEENLNGGPVDLIPGGSQSQRATAVAACEGEVTTSPVDLVLPHYQAGRVEVLMVGRDTPIEPWTDVPTAADLGMPDDPWGQTREVVVPGDVPPEHVDWLFELWSTAVEDPTFVENREQLPGLTMNVRGPDEAEELNRTAFEAAETVTRDLGIHIEQQ